MRLYSMQICILLLFPILTLQSGDLSPFIRPVRYDLVLDTDLESWTYTGSVNVTFDVLKKTDEIRLHATEAVAIGKLTLHDATGKLIYSYIPHAGDRQNTAKDLLVLKPNCSLPIGQYLMRCQFAGVVSKKLTGYYRTGYTMAHGGKYIKMASTHLSPDKTRTVFPSFDEPQFRAFFSLTLIHPANLSATSNMPVVNETLLGNGRKITKFDDTPSMSTYLLAWIQHNFVYEERIQEGVKMRHYTRPGYRSAIQEKIVLLGKTVKFFNDYFKIPYPLPKLDAIGIPNYLVAGMENWGIITLSESVALSRPFKRFGSSELSYRTLIAHEVSHMWFGNLVTMSWWNDLWLKEGMASYLSYPCVNAIYNDVDMNDQFMINIWQTGMFADAMITSHPVQMPIRVTSEITQVFDSITYSKGATVFAMLRDVMGEQKFKAGMSHFLDTYKYSTASYNDILTSMTTFSEAGAVLKQFMDSFILQKNYPLIKLEIINDTKIRLIQSRYVRESGMIIENDSSPFNYSWYIPVTILTDSASRTANKHIMMQEKVMEVSLPKPFKWIKLNSEGIHMYVTHYSNANLNKVLQVVKDNAKDPTLRTMKHRDRAHLICDIFLSAQMKLVPYSTAFEAAKYLRSEKHYLPWSLVYRHLRQIRSMIDESLADCYKQYIIYLLTPQYKTVKEQNDTLIQQLQYQNFVRYSRYIKGKQKAVIYDNDALAALLQNYKTLTPEKRSEVNLLVNTTDQLQIGRIGNTLVEYSSTDASVINSFISYYSKKAPEVVWHVYRDNYKFYNERYGLAQFEYASALKTMIKNQRNKQIITEIETFFKTNTAGSGYLGVKNGLEESKFVSKFKQDSEPELKIYLESQNFCQFST